MEAIKGYWTQQELMQRWGCGRTYLWQMRRDRTGPQSLVIAGKILYPIEDVLRWEKELMVRAGSFRHVLSGPFPTLSAGAPSTPQTGGES